MQPFTGCVVTLFGLVGSCCHQWAVAVLLYVFDEAFDAWSMGKQPGDYHLFFETDWEKDLTAFVKRDRTHPSVVIWSTGNEITERGGLGDGYVMAVKVAEKLRGLDGTRPVSNAICSFWNGLDDQRQEAQMKGMMEAFTGGNLQNADMGGNPSYQ